MITRLLLPGTVGPIEQPLAPLRGALRGRRSYCGRFGKCKSWGALELEASGTAPGREGCPLLGTSPPLAMVDPDRENHRRTGRLGSLSGCS